MFNSSTCNSFLVSLIDCIQFDDSHCNTDQMLSRWEFYVQFMTWNVTCYLWRWIFQKLTPKSPPMPTLHFRLGERHSQSQANKIVQWLILGHTQEKSWNFGKFVATGPRRRLLVGLGFEFDHSNFLWVNSEQAHFEIFKDDVGFISIKFYLSIESCR